MAELSMLERQILEVVADQHAETRRGARAVIIKAALGAQSGQQRGRIDDALVALLRRGLLIQGPAGLVPADEALAAVEEAGGAPAAPTPGACQGCDSRPGQRHAPERPSVDAFRAGRIPGAAEVSGDGSGEALLPIGPNTVERIHQGDGIAISTELLDRCAAMQLALMLDAQRRHAAGEPGALDELVWLRETGRRLVAVGGEA